MNRIIIYFILILSISSCTQYYQVVDVSATNSKSLKNGYVFENDSVQISYYLWASRGVLSFSVYNKLDVPIYIDWKKSAFIRNGEKNDYWKETQVSNSITVSKGGAFAVTDGHYAAGIAQGVSETASTTTIPERVTFISPKSSYKRVTYYIGRLNGVLLDKTTPITEIKRLDVPEKKSKAYLEDYTLEETPIEFRNFLTLSTSENFQTEFYIDNGFYVSHISEVNGKQFANNGEYESPYYDEKKYYTLIPIDNSVKVRAHKK